MIPKKLALAGALFIAAAVQAHAQSEDPAKDAAPAGEPVEAWRPACEMREDGEKLCVLSRRVPGPDDKGVVLAVEFVRAGTASLFARFVTPLSIDLTKGLAYSVLKGGREQPARLLAFRTCTPQGCYAPFEADNATLEAFRLGSQINVRFVALDGREIGAAVGLDGFTKGYEDFVSR